jgi:hypothetical protein
VRLHPHPIPLRPFSCPCGFDPRTTLRSLFQTAAALGVSPLQSFLPSANHDGFVTRRSPPDVSPAFGAGPIFRGLRRPMIRFQLRSISSWLVRCSLGFSVRFHGSLMCLQWVTPGGAPNPLMPFCSQVTLLLRLQRLSTHTTGVPFPKEGADRPSVFCPSESGEPVCFLLHFPWGHPRSLLATTLALRSPDFPLAPWKAPAITCDLGQFQNFRNRSSLFSEAL